MNNRSFNIPASNKNLVDDKLVKLNKRALKLGLEEIIWVWGKAFLNENEILIVPVEISGPLFVQYNDWEFIATLQHLTTGENIIRAIDNTIQIPKEFRESGSSCQHCMVNRYRKDTYLVKNIKTNQIVQVGSSCIKDFLGGQSPDNLLQKAELISGLIEYMEGSSQQFVRSDGIYHLSKVLAQTSACIRDYGWVSKSKSLETGKTSTASWVMDNFNPPTDKFPLSIVDDSDKDLAVAASDWAENLSDAECDSSDYLYNIRAIARSGMVSYRTMGFAASIVTSFQKHLLSTAPKPAKKESNYLGSTKDKFVFELILKHDFPYEGNYGTTYKYIFEDQEGNVLVWNSSNHYDLTRGTKYLVKGTIKDHSEYKGTKQTIITRCQLLSN